MYYKIQEHQRETKFNTKLFARAEVRERRSHKTNKRNRTMKFTVLVLTTSLSIATASDSIRLRGSGDVYDDIDDVDEVRSGAAVDDDDICAVSIRCLDREEAIHDTGMRTKQEVRDMKPCNTFCPECE